MAQSFSWSDVASSSAQQAAVAGAEAEFERLREALVRTQADPFRTRLSLALAEHDFLIAKADLRQVRNETLFEIANAYTRLLTAQRNLEASAQRLDLSERLYSVAEIRARNGSATDLEVREAQTGLEVARREQQRARDELELSLTGIATLNENFAGSAEGLPAAFYDAALPPEASVLASAEEHPELVRARQERSLAEVELTALDPSYTAPVDIEAANARLVAARERERAAERRISLQARDLLADARAAKSECEAARVVRRDALERVTLERRRYDSGLLSDIDLLEAEILAREAELSSLRTCDLFFLSLMELQAGSGADAGLGANREDAERDR